MAQKSTKRQNLIQLIATLLIIILLGYLSNHLFFRLDLTQDKRYTLADETKDFITDLDDIIFIRIYLDGELPASFIKLQRSIKEILDEFRVYNKTNIQYEFINPFDSPDKKTQREIGEQLMKKGLFPTTIYEETDEGQREESIVFSGALITFRDKEISLELLKNNLNVSPEHNLNMSVEALEFELINAFKKLITKDVKNIAFVSGHGELSKLETADIKKSLDEYYTVERININEQLGSLDKFEAIIIAKPDSVFSEKDKFIIDQYIMHGGKVLWLVDGTTAEIDSLGHTGNTMAMANDINLSDQLFKYGARINSNLIQDIQCNALRINTSVAGAPPRFQLFPWIFFPLIQANDNHIITKNLNLLKTEFISSVDPVGKNPDIEKTVLLSSSNLSKSLESPVLVRLDIINDPPEESYFSDSELPLALLLEGKFESLYKNRIPPEIASNREISFKENSTNTRMIVISDGDFIKNQFQIKNGKAYPFSLGYDRHTDNTYGNKEFILNAINYLVDGTGTLAIRSREIKLRLLDRKLVKNHKNFWQVTNIILPVVLVVIFGIFFSLIRKRKFTK